MTRRLYVVPYLSYTFKRVMTFATGYTHSAAVENPVSDMQSIIMDDLGEK